jgi:hypothetical protein
LTDEERNPLCKSRIPTQPQFFKPGTVAIRCKLERNSVLITRLHPAGPLAQKIRHGVISTGSGSGIANAGCCLLENLESFIHLSKEMDTCVRGDRRSSEVNGDRCIEFRLDNLFFAFQ